MGQGRNAGYGSEKRMGTGCRIKTSCHRIKVCRKNGSGSGNRQLCRYWRLLDPEKGKLNKASLKIREKRRILGIILLTGAAAGIVYTGNTVRKYRLAAEKYESIRREVQKTETSYAQDHSGTSIDEITIEEAKLKEINPDYNCWIRIPGTSIDYPAVWGKDDKYYLDHGFNGEKQSGGTIFADSQNIPFVSANTIFYGHNMKDGSMFGDLKNTGIPDF